MSRLPVLDRIDERNERALFARRALALPRASLPSLEAVLAEVDRPARIEPKARGRARAVASAVVTALAVAASVSGLVSMPRSTAGEGDRAIVADRDAAAPPVTPAREGASPSRVSGAEEEATCDEEPRLASLATLSTRDPGACEGRGAPQRPAMTAARSPSLSCEREETCSLAGP